MLNYIYALLSNDFSKNWAKLCSYQQKLINRVKSRSIDCQFHQLNFVHTHTRACGVIIKPF